MKTTSNISHTRDTNSYFKLLQYSIGNIEYALRKKPSHQM